MFVRRFEREASMLEPLLPSLLLACLAGAAAAADSSYDWPLYGRTSDESRFSALTQITPENVRSLGLAFQFEDFVVRGRTHRGNEATPLMSGGVLYFAGPWSVAYAVDARSGK